MQVSVNNQNNVSKCWHNMTAAEGMDQHTVRMQAKVQELDDLSTQKALQIATLREELQGSLAELDQVRLLLYILLQQTHAIRDHVLARCVQQQSAVSRLVCFGQACTISTGV